MDRKRAVSRVELVSWRETSCLCGRGQVTRHVASTDYVFGGADVTFSLDCAECSKLWRFQHKSFTLRSSEVEATALYAKWNAACDAIRAVSPRIVDAHFTTLGKISKKAEMAELTRLGLNPGTYRSYLDARHTKSPGQIAFLHDDCEGVFAIADAEASTLRELVRIRDELRRGWEAAGKRVVRRGLPSS